jgi:hypothetical protein
MIYYFIQVIVIVLFEIQHSSQNDYNLKINSFQKPLHFQEAVKYINQNLKYKNEFINEEVLANFKAQFANLLNNIQDDNLFKKMLLVNITKPCVVKLEFFLQQFKFKKEWPLKG